MPSTQKGHSFEVLADPAKNRLVVRFVGEISVDIAHAAVAQLVEKAGLLGKGFDVITDISNAKMGHVSTAPVLRGAMELLSAHGVRKVVRVVGPARIILAQFKRITDGFKGYKPIYVATMEDAEKLLSR